MRILLLALAVSCSMIGCAAMIPDERSSTLEQRQLESMAGETTTDVVTASKTTPPNVTIETTAKDGTTFKLTQPASTESTTTAATRAKEDSNLDASGTSIATVTIPLYVKLIGSAIGLFLLLTAGWLILRSSRAVRASWDVVDGTMGDVIHKVRTKAATTNDPALRTELIGMAADLERDRVNFHKEP